MLKRGIPVALATTMLAGVMSTVPLNNTSDITVADASTVKVATKSTKTTKTISGVDSLINDFYSGNYADFYLVKSKTSSGFLQTFKDKDSSSMASIEKTNKKKEISTYILDNYGATKVKKIYTIVEGKNIEKAGYTKSNLKLGSYKYDYKKGLIYSKGKLANSANAFIDSSKLPKGLQYEDSLAIKNGKLYNKSTNKTVSGHLSVAYLDAKGTYYISVYKGKIVKLTHVDSKLFF